MSHIAANPETIRMRGPATVSGSGIEFATMLFPNIEGTIEATSGTIINSQVSTSITNSGLIDGGGTGVGVWRQPKVAQLS